MTEQISGNEAGVGTPEPVEEPSESLVFIARHGFSAFNQSKDQTFPSQREIPLADLGHQQAISLADALAALNITPEVIVVSNTVRSRQTAKHIEEKFPTVNIEEWPDLHELDYMSYYSDKSPKLRESMRDHYWNRNPDPDYRPGNLAAQALGGSEQEEYERRKPETFREFIGRVDSIIERMRTIDRRTLIVGHEYFIDAIEWRLINPGQEIGSNSVVEFRNYQAQKKEQGRRTENTSLHAVNLTGKGAPLTELYRPTGALIPPATILPTGLK